MRTSTASTIVSLFLLTEPQSLLPGLAFANAAPTTDGKGTCKAPHKGGDAPTKVDVAVVGGGFSGMASAYELHKAGLSIVVLEATDVLGGRSRSRQLESGPGLVEMGATWINNITQPNVTTLVEEFGLELINQLEEGALVRQHLDGSVVIEDEDDLWVGVDSNGCYTQLMLPS
jgi:monoamine oxidase